jgi:hypothetical protein
MSTIYSDQYKTLNEILSIAGKKEDATLLIPDLQRPYVWTPLQVTVLVDSLIRGWPFGTLLTWKVKSDDPARDLARSFWQIVDRTNEDDGEPISKQHPPATFLMVLDGQQRVQSLLLALGGDGWGFKLPDRIWHELLTGAKPRGPRGQSHWSLGCLCVDLPALKQAYLSTKSAALLDYTSILKWVVTDTAIGQSKFKKLATYVDPLPNSLVPENAGHFIRLSRLWEAAPEQSSADAYEAEDIADKLLAANGVADAERETMKRPAGALLMVLKEVKRTRVTYLELAEYGTSHGPREKYNDAIVNIFTRLNTAGRTLTREDITFAWLKVGWNTGMTQNRSARDCIDTLTRQLTDLSISLSVEDVISAITLVWSVSFNEGKLLTNNDLMKGDAIRPMAAHVSENWNLVVEAVTRVCEQANNRGLRFREHYQSVNAVAYLWAWYFGALRWRQSRPLRVLEKDGLDKSLAQTLDDLMDHWLICSQWAGVWASASAERLSGYAARLANCLKEVAPKADVTDTTEALKQQLQTEVKELEQSAINSLATMNADDRQQVRNYYTALWLWNRLDKSRWEKVKIALRLVKTRKENSLDVDHIVAWELWQSKFETFAASVEQSSATVGTNFEELRQEVNSLGNCMLLEKNFNISKSNKTLKDFLGGVYDFQTGKVTIKDWSKALDLDDHQVDPTDTSVLDLAELFKTRTSTIRQELEAFVRGTKTRMDLEQT